MSLLILPSSHFYSKEEIFLALSKDNHLYTNNPVEINLEQANKKIKDYSEVAIVRESVTISCIW